MGRAVQSGTGSLGIRLGGMPIFNKKLDICKDTVISLPMGFGKMYCYAIACPAAPGTISIKQVIDLSPKVICSTYNVQFSASDPHGELLCLNIKMVISGC